MHKYVILFILMLCSAKAFSCSCGPDYNLEKRHMEADAIFIGTLESKGIFYSFSKNEFGFDNLTILKGASGNTVKVVTKKGTSACGLDYEKGVRYIVYAYKSKEKPNTLTTSRCTAWPIVERYASDSKKFFEFYKVK